MYRTLVFAHANSFPASTYRTLLDGWRAAGFQVHAVDRFGHDPRYPVTPDWPHLVDQLHDFIAHEVGHPVFLVGHSLGGFLAMMLARRHPALAQGVVVMDSPLLSGWKAAAIGLAKRAGAMHRVMPSRISAQRTHEWASEQHAHQHFRGKAKFAAFHPSVLHDYVHSGTEMHPDGTGRRLRFHREIETAIYDTMPHGLLQEFRRHPHRCPLAFIAGTRSRELRSVGLSGTRQVFGDRISWIEGTHLYPFEQPERTTAEVLRWLEVFLAEAPAPAPAF